MKKIIDLIWALNCRRIHIACLVLTITNVNISYAENNYGESLLELQESLGAFRKLASNPLLTPVIKDPKEYIVSKPGRYYFSKIIDNTNSEDQLLEVQKTNDTEKIDSFGWVRNIGGRLVEEWITKPDGSVHLIAETDRDSGYRVLLKSHMVSPSIIVPGQKWSNTSELEAYNLETPYTISYKGELKSEWSYVGYYNVDIPAGTFNAALIKEDYKIQVGPVKIADTRYSFYAQDIGKIAEVDGMHASAFLVIHSIIKSSKILINYEHDMPNE